MITSVKCIVSLKMQYKYIKERERLDFSSLDRRHFKLTN